MTENFNNMIISGLLFENSINSVMEDAVYFEGNGYGDSNYGLNGNGYGNGYGSGDRGVYGNMWGGGGSYSASGYKKGIHYEATTIEDL